MTIEIIERALVSEELLVAAKDVLGTPINSTDALQDQCVSLDSLEFPRAELSRTLLNYNEFIGNDDRACVNASRLADPRAVAIVAGQQAGLFTGPAYTIHKAITTIKLAESMERRLDRPVIPIFWSATEDHDLSEVASCHFPEASWTAGFPDAGLATEHFDSKPVAELLPDFLKSIPEYVRSTAAEILHVGHDNYGAYASSVMARLFAGTGLVMLEPKLLRPLAGGFYANALLANDRLKSALDTCGERLRDMDVEPGFQPDDSSGLFRIDADGVRRRLSRVDGGFDLGGQVMTVDEAVALVRSSNGETSTAAWLRPVLQNQLVPTLAFVAGPGELRYHLQLKGVFDALGVTMAPLWLRNHATVFGGREAKLWKKLNWTPDDLYRTIDDLRPPSELPDETARVFDDGLAAINSLGDSLIRDLADYSCESTIAGFRTKTEKEFGKIRNRVVKEWQTREGVDNRRIDTLRRIVRPGNAPQERRLNVIALLSSYGSTLIEELLQLFDPYETGHYLVFKD